MDKSYEVTLNISMPEGYDTSIINRVICAAVNDNTEAYVNNIGEYEELDDGCECPFDGDEVNVFAYLEKCGYAPQPQSENLLDPIKNTYAVHTREARQYLVLRTTYGNRGMQFAKSLLSLFFTALTDIDVGYYSSVSGTMSEVFYVFPMNEEAKLKFKNI